MIQKLSYVQQSMVLNDFSLGTTPPVFGLQRTYWSTEGDQVGVFPPQLSVASNIDLLKGDCFLME
jgi:hypothetical protein